MVKNNKNYVTSLALAASLTACGGGGSSGGNNTDDGNNTEPQILNEGEAREVITSFLKDAREDVSAKVAFSPMEELLFDDVGEFSENGRTVGVLYNEDSSLNGTPSVSPSLDYVVSIPKSTEEEIRDEMNSLDGSKFGPVVKNRKNLEDISVAQQLSGEITIRDENPSSIVAICDIVNSSGDSITSFSPKFNEDKFSIPSNSGFSLVPDEYKANCSFTDNDENETVVDSAFEWQVTAMGNTAPSVLGVKVQNEDSLLKYDGNIRDVNEGVTIFYDSITDSEDSELGLSPTVEGYVAAGGETTTYEVSDKSFSFDPKDLGGLEAEIGFRATDSLGATGKGKVTEVIDKNAAPECSGVVTSQEYIQGTGTKTIVNESDCSDLEGDSFIIDSNTFDTAQSPGDYSKTVSVEDEFGASKEYTIQIANGENTAPEITGVQVANEPLRFNGDIRDVADEVTVSYDTATDAESSVSVEGFVETLDGTDTYSVNSKSFNFDPTQYAGLEGKLGFTVTDTQGKTTIEYITENFHKNTAPECDVDASQSYTENTGTKTIVYSSDCSDLQGDSISLSGNTFDTSVSPGTYTQDVKASDNFSATNTYQIDVTIEEGGIGEFD